MSYYNCPRCALAIKVRAPDLALTSCPRCLARYNIAVPLYETPEPARPSLFRRTTASRDSQFRDPPPREPGKP